MSRKPFLAIVYVSRHGHTKLQAEAVARGAAAGGARVKLFTSVNAAKKFAELDTAAGLALPPVINNRADSRALSACYQAAYRAPAKDPVVLLPGIRVPVLGQV